MRILLLLLGVFLVYTSCAKTEDAIFNETSQKWLLVKMTTSFVNSETTGKEMAWQESLIFNTDGTFIKSRTIEGAEKEAFGTYLKIDNTDYSYLELEYTSGSELKASCGQSETLSIIGGNLLVGSWNICDGPRLEYKQSNK
jgi:hypothetical protein